MMNWKHAAVLALAAGSGIAACADDDTIAPDGEAPFAVVIAPEPGTSGAALRAEGPSAARIPLDQVGSIVLPIGEVEVHEDGEEPGGGEWLLVGSIDDDVDLLALPAEGYDVLDSSLPVGEYDMIRLWLTDGATIELLEDVTVGRTTYEAGIHPLRIPSADQAGVRLHADFTVDDDGELLTILFDGDATLTGVTATGSGMLKIAPVLTVMDEDGDEVGSFDDDEGEDEDEIEFGGVVTATSATGFTLDDGTVIRIVDATELSGDILSLEALAAAVSGGETVEAEGEGAVAEDGTTLIAAEVEFEVDDD